MRLRRVQAAFTAAAFLLFAAPVWAADEAASAPVEERAPAVTTVEEWDVDGLEKLLPRYETPEEREFRENLLRSGPLPAILADPPPTAPIRNCAEWEPAVGVLIRYPLGLPYNLLQDFDDSNILYVLVSAANFSNAQTSLTNNGVNMAQVQWLIKPNDSIWTRDYGPQFVFDGNGVVGIIDHKYNRPQRPNDDLIPYEFGNTFGYTVYRHDMWHTGGNYMTDGAYFSMSTDLVYDEAASANGMTPAQVDQLMLDYYGIDPYNVVDDISVSGIHHIDTWAKFLNEETVLIKEVWPAHFTYTALEQRAVLIASLQASTGRNYTVHRVFCYQLPNGTPAAYTNSLVLNDRIYAPLFGNASHDANALQAYRDALPGYDVRGYTYGGFITDDALHCRAIGIMDKLMLRVAHVPVVETQTEDVELTAFVDDRSGAGVTSVDLHYRYDQGPWIVEPMTGIGGDLYSATLPAPAVPTAALVSTDYYIHATDASGRAEGVPRMEPAGWFTFDFDVATDAPVVVSTADEGKAFPNPFRNSTTFEFTLRYPDVVHLSVYDVRGRLVRKLTDDTWDAGQHRIEWDGRDEEGHEAPAGMYYFRLRAAGIAYSRPVALVR
jgi:agmatine/peptidylarginine deiminase